MAFERKELQKEKPKTIYWNILKWYLLIVPTFSFLFLVPRSTQGMETPDMTPDQVFALMFQLLNYSLAGILVVTNPVERSKTGIADIVLKIVIAQQFLAQNILGLLLTIFVWYQLPYRVDEKALTKEELEGLFFKPKTLLILAGVTLGITILIIGGQFALL